MLAIELHLEAGDARRYGQAYRTTITMADRPSYWTSIEHKASSPLKI